LYLYWTPVGAARVPGVQGRYLLPLLAPLAVTFGSFPYMTTPRVARASFIALVGTICSLLLITHLTVASAYSRLGPIPNAVSVARSHFS